MRTASDRIRLHSRTTGESSPETSIDLSMDRSTERSIVRSIESVTSDCSGATDAVPLSFSSIKRRICDRLASVRSISLLSRNRRLSITSTFIGSCTTIRILPPRSPSGSTWYLRMML